MMHAPNHSKGVALIEVLVSLVVLAIGILGLAGLQFFALKFNRSSLERVQATSLTYQLGDKMRANPLQARSGSYKTSCGTAPATTIVTATDTPTKNCTTAKCTLAELAAYDLTTWCVSIVSGIAGAYGTETCADSPCTALSQHRVTVAWPEAKVGEVALTNCADSTIASGYSCITVAVQP